MRRWKKLWWNSEHFAALQREDIGICSLNKCVIKSFSLYILVICNLLQARLLIALQRYTEHLNSRNEQLIRAEIRVQRENMLLMRRARYLDAKTLGLLVKQEKIVQSKLEFVKLVKGVLCGLGPFLCGRLILLRCMLFPQGGGKSLLAGAIFMVLFYWGIKESYFLFSLCLLSVWLILVLDSVYTQLSVLYGDIRDSTGITI